MGALAPCQARVTMTGRERACVVWGPPGCICTTQEGRQAQDTRPTPGGGWVMEGQQRTAVPGPC